MSSIDRRELMRLAESFKSFPKAVAAIVLAMFDRGAGQIRISFIETSEGSSDLYITADKAVIRETELHDPRATIWILPHVHHSDGAVLYTDSCDFVDLGVGEGVNPRQDRSAKRLVRELSRHLSPSEAYRTVVIDEQGTEHKLVKSLPSTTIDGLRVSWPEKLVGFGREGLILKFGAVRVSMRSFLDRLILEPKEHEQLMLLTHPWLQGIVEVEVADSQVAGIPIPPKPGDNLSNFIIPSGHVRQLAMAILQIVPAVALREMNKLVTGYIRDFVEGDGLFLSGHTYKIVCADPLEVQHSEGRLLWKRPGSTSDTTQLLLDATNPVFLTVSTYDQEVMQVIWWQLAIWIAQNQPELFEEAAHFNLRVNRIYLALREQNPERWDD